MATQFGSLSKIEFVLKYTNNTTQRAMLIHDLRNQSFPFWSLRNSANLLLFFIFISSYNFYIFTQALELTSLVLPFARSFHYFTCISSRSLSINPISFSLDQLASAHLRGRRGLYIPQDFEEVAPSKFQVGNVTSPYNVTGNDENVLGQTFIIYNLAPEPF